MAARLVELSSCRGANITVPSLVVRSLMLSQHANEEHRVAEVVILVLEPIYQKAPATIHILLVTANDKKVLRALPVTHRRSKKSVASQPMAILIRTKSFLSTTTRSGKLQSNGMQPRIHIHLHRRFHLHLHLHLQQRRLTPCCRLELLNSCARAQILQVRAKVTCVLF